jgi:hypothetical protein
MRTLVIGDGYEEHIGTEQTSRSPEEIVAEVRARPEHISDWAYTKDGKHYGHYTTPVMTAYATPKQRAEMGLMLDSGPLEAKDR